MKRRCFAAFRVQRRVQTMLSQCSGSTRLKATISLLLGRRKLMGVNVGVLIKQDQQTPSRFPRSFGKTHLRFVFSMTQIIGEGQRILSFRPDFSSEHGPYSVRRTARDPHMMTPYEFGLSRSNVAVQRRCRNTVQVSAGNLEMTRYRAGPSVPEFHFRSTGILCFVWR